jgi:hypothetical protein
MQVQALRDPKRQMHWLLHQDLLHIYLVQAQRYLSIFLSPFLWVQGYQTVMK